MESLDNIQNKELKYKKTAQNGVPPLARLQQKVARLEITLRDKDSELHKLYSSTKTTLVNELKVQTEMYYQEVVRLRDQLSILQASNEPLQHNLSCNSQNVMKIPTNNKGHPDERLFAAIEKLKEDNKKLNQQLSLVKAEKAQLATEYKNVVNKKVDKTNKSEPYLLEEATQTSPKHEPLYLSTSPQSNHSCDGTENSINVLKNQIEELQEREKTWEEERSNYKEIVNNLKEDRVFFKDASQQKHHEVASLQSEMMKLHKEVLVLQKEMLDLSQGSAVVCNNCTKNSKSSKRLSKEGEKAKSKSKSPSRSSKSLPGATKHRISTKNSTISPTNQSNSRKTSASSGSSSSVQVSPAHEKPKRIPVSSSGSSVNRKSLLTQSSSSPQQSSSSKLHSRSKSLSKSLTLSSATSSIKSSSVQSPSLKSTDSERTKGSSNHSKSSKSLRLSFNSSSRKSPQSSVEESDNGTGTSSVPNSPSVKSVTRSPSLKSSTGSASSAKKVTLKKSNSSAKEKKSPLLNSPISSMKSVSQSPSKAVRRFSSKSLSSSVGNSLPPQSPVNKDEVCSSQQSSSDQTEGVRSDDEVSESKTNIPSIEHESRKTSLDSNKETASQLSTEQEDDESIIGVIMEGLEQELTANGMTEEQNGLPDHPVSPPEEDFLLKQVETENLSTIVESHLVRKEKLKQLKVSELKDKGAVKKKKSNLKKSTRLSCAAESVSQDVMDEFESFISILEAHVSRKALLTLLSTQDGDDST